MENLSQRLINKSIEAFVMGLEIYNKPTIKYRVEGFSFFICNAWELMLKAYLVNKDGEQSIYYKDKANRTLSLNKVIDIIFTNKHDGMRENLEKIIDLRNTSTHFITEEYELIYVPLFQACVNNYVEKMQEYHNVDITKYISANFISLNTRIENLSNDEIRTKYSKITAEKLIKSKNKITKEINSSSNKFAIPIKANLYITKNENQADIKVAIKSKSDTNIAIVNKMQDISNVYPYTTKDVIKQVNKKLKQKDILIVKIKQGKQVKGIFNTYDFQLFTKFYGLKEDNKYSYHITVGNRFVYNMKTVDLIVEKIIENLKIKTKK